MIDENFVSETLDWCARNYVPPIKKHITCRDFGNCDSRNRSCRWCNEMTPYQWQMCCDESWLTYLLSPMACKHKTTRKEAAEFVQEYKSKYPMTPHAIVTCEYYLRKEEHDNE